jgi:hypothetical protein
MRTGMNCWPTSCGEPPEERIALVSIVTPNHIHFPVAKAFVEAGFHVVCDKPLVHTARRRLKLVAAVRKQGTVFGVTYNYTGYPLVRQAREMVRAGELGDIRKVVVEYNQGWLATKLEADGQQAGRLAQRPGAERRRRGAGRHRLACREPRGGGHGTASWKASAPTSRLRPRPAAGRRRQHAAAF